MNDLHVLKSHTCWEDHLHPTLSLKRDRLLDTLGEGLTHRELLVTARLLLGANIRREGHATDKIHF